MLKKIVWLGDSKKVASLFPIDVKTDLGFQLYRLQQGLLPIRSRPMKSVGKSVYELKKQDSSGWYRVIYTVETAHIIYILHSFKKQSAKTAKQDLDIAKSRLKGIL